MAGSKNKSVYSSYSLYPNLLRLVFIIIVIISVSASSQEVSNSTAVIKYLPGFSGPLPFYFETGYIGVDEKEDVQLFYYFVKSGRNPMKDPVMLWLTGGPGCSAFSGLVYEIGDYSYCSVIHACLLSEYRHVLESSNGLLMHKEPCCLHGNFWRSFIVHVITLDIYIGSSYLRWNFAN
ncbi:hypothetical protein MKW92_031666 [Papaver armeniacum]|nr:hypothetical protein MKW92_031666 [Papaver armeniacum]